MTSWKLAGLVFWSIAYSPWGIAQWMQNGYSPFKASLFGALGGILSTSAQWSLCFFLSDRPQVKAIVEKFWHFAPVKVERHGWLRRLPYLSVVVVSYWDVWFGFAAGKFFRLNRWRVLVITVTMSTAKNFTPWLILGVGATCSPFVRRHTREVFLATLCGMVAPFLWQGLLKAKSYIHERRLNVA